MARRGRPVIHGDALAAAALSLAPDPYHRRRLPPFSGATSPPARALRFASMFMASESRATEQYVSVFAMYFVQLRIAIMSKLLGVE
jgi:hypothetical protein